jgi:hypothetical protein
MDVACLERVGADLAPVARYPAAQAFNTELERDIGTRTSRDLEAARRCITVGNIECADQRLKLPLALRRNDTPVQALQEQLNRARTAVDAAKSCLASSATDCVAVPLDGLRQASPQSPLIKGLEQRAQLASLPQEPVPSESAQPSVALKTPAPQPLPLPVPALAPPPDPSAALIQRLVNEGERCRVERDCGCMKDKAVAVSNIDPQNQWAVGIRKSASECARAKLEIR